MLEGVNALQFRDRLDVGVYLHASEAAMEDWYVHPLPRAVRRTPPPGSFYAQFAGSVPTSCGRSPSTSGTAVNLLNLREYIRPTLANADIVVEKRADHSVGRVDVINVGP